MFIRKTKVKSTRNSNQGYYTFRIVETERLGQKVKQRTLLNLGKHFDIEASQWSLLCSRIEQLMRPTSDLFADLSLDSDLEVAAERYAALIIHKQGQQVTPPVDAMANNDSDDYHPVNLHQLDVCRPRSMGVESVVYHAMEQLALPQCLMTLGFNGKDLAAAIGQVTARLASPGSERHTLQWLQQQSGLGEILDHDFETTSLTRLYEVSDKLYAHRGAIEAHLCQREADLFTLERRIILYDLTNTYFEGRALSNDKAQFGRSKEKRSDCRLVTLGLILDGDGFPLHSQLFEGNVSEPGTLEEMIKHLSGQENIGPKPIIIMDAGIATEDNITTLREQNYRYLVVSRDRKKQMPDLEQGAVLVKEDANNRVIVEKVTDESAQEVRVYCHSQAKEKKEQAMRDKVSQRFEQALTQLNEGLNKKGCTKRYDKIIERIGRIKQKYSRVAKQYRIEVSADDEKVYAQVIHWKKIATQKEENQGVYCLRSNIMDWAADTLWRTYVMLTEVEATFRSLKTDFGLRPVYHQKEDRVGAHLFISLLAYHIAHTLRVQLKNHGIHLSWGCLRQCLSTQQRVTVTLPTKDQRVAHVRTTSRAEAEQQTIYAALGMPADRLGKHLTFMEEKSKK